MTATTDRPASMPEDLMVIETRANELKEQSVDWPDWDLTPRQTCDLELLLNGAFAPLQGFLGKDDYEAVCRDMRLADGSLWPIPITLDVDETFAASLADGSRIALRDPEGTMLAVLTVTDIWTPDLDAEALAVYGTSDETHPAVAFLKRQTKPVYVGGTLEGVQSPQHFDSVTMRHTPAQLKRRFAERGWTKVVAFQTRNPMHRAHQELTLRAAVGVGANLLIHPVVGMTRPGDLDHYTRVRCYQALLERYPKHTVMLSLLPLAMRMGGPREAVWHALIRRNYGCTHLIVGRDHAGPGNGADGKPFYGPYDAQQLLEKHQQEIGVEMVPFRMMVYLPQEDRYAGVDEIDKDTQTQSISGTDLRQRLAQGREIPEWFTYPEVARELQLRHPPRSRQGMTVFFTGLSGSGKSTVANVLRVKLLENGNRPVTLLDGDIVRTNLSSELGFSKEHRDINIRRIGYVASEITKNGGIAICAPIAPYESVRREVRELIEPLGGFAVVHVSTPIEVCEQRDRKGLYAKARAGIIKEFTGISDPYEAPVDADVVLDTSDLSPEAAAQQILLYLEKEGYLGPQSER